MAQLHAEARRHLRIKLARYWARTSPNRDDIDLLEMDEELVRSAVRPASPYDVEQVSPEDAPNWERSE